MKRWFFLVLGLIGVSSGCTRLACTFQNDLDWKLQQSEHFIFYFRANSLAERDIHRIIPEKETGFHTIINRLNVHFNGVIHYYMYNPEERGQIGADGHANAAFETVYEIYSGYLTGCHETAHVIAQQTIGSGKTQMMLEGLAVALAGPYRGNNLISEMMSDYKRSNRLIPVHELIANPGKYDEGPFYVQGGSFVNYLLEKYGSDKIKRLYTTNRDEFAAVFGTVYSIDLNQVEIEYFQNIK